jgi:hypothetical protein
MARTAVIAGTATAVSGSMQRNAAEKQQTQAEAAAWEQQQQQAAWAAQQQAAAPAPAPVAAAPAADDLTSQLEKLASLKAAGILDDAEFAAAKAKLLG